MMLEQAIYSGKAKHLYEYNNNILMEFTDNITAFNGTKRDVLSGKGQINNTINTWFMELFAKNGVQTHFINKIDHNKAEVKRLKIIPLECIMRNYASGSICQRLGLIDRMKLDTPIYQLCLKDDMLGDPTVSEYEAISLGWASKFQLEVLHALTTKINTILVSCFASAGFILADFKLEFGVDGVGEIYLADELTPDSCRIWDCISGEIYDKDRFRKDLGSVVLYYQKIAQRLGINLDL